MDYNIAPACPPGLFVEKTGYLQEILPFEKALNLRIVIKFKLGIDDNFIDQKINIFSINGLS